MGYRSVLTQVSRAGLWERPGRSRPMRCEGSRRWIEIHARCSWNVKRLACPLLQSHLSPSVAAAQALAASLVLALSGLARLLSGASVGLLPQPPAFRGLEHRRSRLDRSGAQTTETAMDIPPSSHPPSTEECSAKRGHEPAERLSWRPSQRKSKVSWQRQRRGEPEAIPQRFLVDTFAELGSRNTSGE